MKSEVHITTHSGKMLGVRSISTNPLSNPFCMTMHSCGKENIICTKCYATNLVGFRNSLKEHMQRNSELLSRDIISMDSLPKYDDEFMRFNSFGEIINNTHLLNLFNICYANPNTLHVIYTKMPSLFSEFHHLKPDNLRIIESNFFINEVKKCPSSPLIDAIFNVVTPGYIEAHPETKVNCMQSCNECRKCYTRRITTKSIVELIK